MTLVTNTLSISDSTPKVRGFGTALIAGYHTLFNGVRAYSADTDGLNALVAAGLSVDDEIYQVAQTFCSQTPHAHLFKIGNLNTPITETFTLTVTAATAGQLYTVLLRVGSGSIQVLQYTPTGSPTVTTIAAALVALLIAVSGVTASNASGVITIGSSGAKPVKIRGFTRNMSLVVNAPATNFATDLASINQYDNDWYGLLLAGTSAVQVAAGQTFAEANGKLYVGSCANSDCMDPVSTTDALSIGKASNLHRSFIVATRDQGGRADAALLARSLAFGPPKVSTWHAKGLSGPLVDALSGTEIGAIQTKRGIAYYNELGLPMSHDGWAPSGRYADITILADWVVARINEALVGVLANNETIPFSSVGEAIVNSAVSGVLALAESAGVIAPAGSPGGWTVSVPVSSSLSPNDRAGRKMPGVRYTFRALGSVHTLDVTGAMGV